MGRPPQVGCLADWAKRAMRRYLAWMLLWTWPDERLLLSAARMERATPSLGHPVLTNQPYGAITHRGASPPTALCSVVRYSRLYRSRLGKPKSLWPNTLWDTVLRKERGLSGQDLPAHRGPGREASCLHAALPAGRDRAAPLLLPLALSRAARRRSYRTPVVAIPYRCGARAGRVRRSGHGGG